MAAHALDVDLATLTSSAQIFSPPDLSTGASYTLPQIRSLHKQIHLAIDDKKSRLRTQVGGSYRELLGTADAIVRMRADMDDVQGILGTMGARCGRGVVGDKINGLVKFADKRDGVVEHKTGRRSLGAAARGKLLAGCVLVLGKLLKGSRGVGDTAVGDGETLVTAAKVAVLGALLVTGFEETKPDVEIRAAVHASIQSLQKLRTRLQQTIDNVLGTIGGTTNRVQVLQALCAHSLATRSGAREVIRHFLRVRGSALDSVFKVEENRSTMDMVKGLELYTKTILDVQALTPNKVTEALASLKRDTLLSDPSLRELEGLRLDIYERWCSDAVQRYKHTLRDGEFYFQQVIQMLKSWSTHYSTILLAGLEKTLERTTDFKALTDMRTEVLALWIRDGGKARGFDPAEMLDRLRRTINAHIMGVLDAKVHKLRLVGSEVAATLEVWRRAGVGEAQRGLWDIGDGLDMELHHGAGPFAQDVIGRLYGRNDAVARAVTGYKSWASVIGDVEEVVEQLKRQRWDNDVDEIEDDETIDNRQQALSRDDPAKLQERLDEALEKAFKELDKQLAELWETEKSGENSGKVAMYLLRILRDIRAKLPKLATVKGFGLEMVPSLQETIAATVVLSPVDEFTDSALARNVVVGRSLWDGTPELPTSPSPGVFRLLRGLTMAMSDAGTDLWSPSAVSVLKQLLAKELSGRWTKALEAHVAAEKPKAEDSEEAQPEEEKPEPEEEKPEPEEEKPEPEEEKLETEKGDIEGEETDSKADEQKSEQGEEKAAEDEPTPTDAEPVQSSEAEDSAQEEEEAQQTAEAEAEAEDALLADKVRRELLIQWLFDLAMLRCPVGSSHELLTGLEEAVWESAGLEEASARQRLNKTAQEYWKRSSLLFGLLA